MILITIGKKINKKMKSYIQTLLFTVISAQPFSPITKVIVRKQKKERNQTFF